MEVSGGGRRGPPPPPAPPPCPLSPTFRPTLAVLLRQVDHHLVVALAHLHHFPGGWWRVGVSACAGVGVNRSHTGGECTAAPHPKCQCRSERPTPSGVQRTQRHTSAAKKTKTDTARKGSRTSQAKGQSCLEAVEAPGVWVGGLVLRHEGGVGVVLGGLHHRHARGAVLKAQTCGVVCCGG